MSLKIVTELSDEEKKVVAAVEAKAEALWTEIHNMAEFPSRELALAKTKVEEAVLWVRQHLFKAASATITPPPPVGTTVTPPAGSVTTEGQTPTKS